MLSYQAGGRDLWGVLQCTLSCCGEPWNCPVIQTQLLGDFLTAVQMASASIQSMPACKEGCCHLLKEGRVLLILIYQDASDSETWTMWDLSTPFLGKINLQRPPDSPISLPSGPTSNKKLVAAFKLCLLSRFMTHRKLCSLSTLSHIGRSQTVKW